VEAAAQHAVQFAPNEAWNGLDLVMAVEEGRSCSLSIQLADELRNSLPRMNQEQPSMRGVEVELRSNVRKRVKRVSLPLVRSKRPGSLKVDNDKIYDLISFP
jgi:hypothetical protein